MASPDGWADIPDELEDVVEVLRGAVIALEHDEGADDEAYGVALETYLDAAALRVERAIELGVDPSPFSDRPEEWEVLLAYPPFEEALLR